LGTEDAIMGLGPKNSTECPKSEKPEKGKKKKVTGTKNIAS